MASQMYIARCQWCGKTGGSSSGTSTGGPQPFNHTYQESVKAIQAEIPHMPLVGI